MYYASHLYCDAFSEALGSGVTAIPPNTNWSCIAILFREVVSVGVSWEFPSRVVLNLVVCNFYAEALFCALLRPFAPFCALLRTCVCAHLRSFARICVFLRPTAFRTTVFGNCEVSDSLGNFCISWGIFGDSFADPPQRLVLRLFWDFGPGGPGCPCKWPLENSSEVLANNVKIREFRLSSSKIQGRPWITTFQPSFSPLFVSVATPAEPCGETRNSFLQILGCEKL